MTEALLKRAREAAASQGAELVVVCAPSQFQIYDDAWRELLGTDRKSVVARYRQDVPNQRLAEAASRTGVRLFDLLPGMREAARATGTPLYYPRDGHWTPAGHAVAARLIAAHLREQSLAASVESFAPANVPALAP